MSFQKKYYYSFRDLNNIQYQVEIWQDTANVITAEEIKGDSKPFTIEYPVSNLFYPIKGSGCEINIVSTTDRKFIGLYTADMLEYQIRFFKAGVLIWTGYLDSELYNENFTEINNYTVTFTGSDGFALLDRINYVDNSNNNYTGVSSHWQVIQNILNKLSLPYQNIYVNLSTVSNDFTIASGETIFHKTYCNNQNWYNEDLEPETSRKVLESILQPYGAIIIQDNASIFITDINTIAGATTTTFKKYDSSFNYVSTQTFNLNLGDLTAIKFASNDSKMNVVSGFNKQVIKYSPYIEPKLIDFTNTDFSNYDTSSVFGNVGYRWTETIYSISNTWNRFNNGYFADCVGYETTNKENTDSYLKINTYSTSVINSSTKSFTQKMLLPYLIPCKGKLIINCKAFARTVADLENTNYETDSIYQIKLRCRLKINDKQYYWNSYFSKGWIDVNDSRNLNLVFERMSIVSGSIYTTKYDKLDNDWIDLNIPKTNSKLDSSLTITPIDFSIPLNTGFSGGVIDFEIYDFDILAAYGGSQAINHDAVKASIIELRIKDFVLKIVDENGNEINKTDVEYVGFMDAKYKNEGETITTLQGTSKIDNSIEKAALLGYNGNYYFLKNWTRAGKTDIIENLLLRSIVSNYTNKRIELNSTINQLNSILGCVKYQNFIPNTNLMICGCTQNFEDSTTDITIQEVIQDNLDINKSF